MRSDDVCLPIRDGVQARAELIAKKPSLQADCFVFAEIRPKLRREGVSTSKSRIAVNRRGNTGQICSHEILVVPDESFQCPIH
jgi:hypothetical protein